MTVAGSDSGGGAGVAADLKTFEAHGVWGTAAVVAVTAQNTRGVQAIEPLSPATVRAQIESVVSDIGVDAAKTGMLATAGLVSAVAAAVRDFGVGPLVVDPVLASSHLDPLLAGDALDPLRDELLPLATVVTPNLIEASVLVGADVADREGMVEAARVLLGFGPKVVLVKGGHLDGDESPDLLLAAGADPVWLEAARLPPPASTHGTGCVLSAAIAAEMARGMEPADACVAAKRFVEKAIAHAGPFGVDPAWSRIPST